MTTFAELAVLERRAKELQSIADDLRDAAASAESEAEAAWDEYDTAERVDG